MIYYILLILATVLYALSFLANKKVEACCHETVDTSVLFLFVTQAEVFLTMLVLLGGQLRFTPFSVLCAMVQALLLGIFAFLNLKALGAVDVGKYSLYTMLGGMLVPFVYGVLFAGEGLTAGKALCCILVSAALAFETWGTKTKRKDILYLLGVFLVNGLFGVLAAVHQNSSFEHLDTLEFMGVQSLTVCVFAGAFLLFRRIKTGKLHAVKEKGVKAYLYMLLYGVFFYSAELILLFAIIWIPVSVQYPIITGGTLIFSALIGMLTGAAPQKKRLLSLGMTLAGLLLLML